MELPKLFGCYSSAISYEAFFLLLQNDHGRFSTLETQITDVIHLYFQLI